MSTPTLDGSAVFGYAVSIVETPEEYARQANEYFGIDGIQSLFGGQRGRTFAATGVLMADSIPDLYLARSFLLSYADGFTHYLVDTYGNTWPNVLVSQKLDWTGLPRPMVAAGFGAGYGRHYKIIMVGLT